jgi:hypothetical protein
MCRSNTPPRSAPHASCSTDAFTPTPPTPRKATLDGDVAFDVRHHLSPGADIVEGITAPPQRIHEITLTEDQSVDMVDLHDVGSSKRPVAAARHADVAVVIAPFGHGQAYTNWHYLDVTHRAGETGWQ